MLSTNPHSSHLKSNKLTMSSLTKFCKVCQDAGKPESVFRSHFIRESPEPNSKVVCPTLLSQNCNYCLKKGHTVKYCPVLKQKAKQDKQREYANRRASEKQIEKPVAKGNAKSSSVFMVLNVSDSEEDEEVVHNPVIEEFPSLCCDATACVTAPKNNYLSALVSKKEPIADEKITKPVAPKQVSTAKPAPWSSNATKTSRWTAMDSDSEDEDEDEEDDSFFNKAPIILTEDEVFNSDW